MTNQELPLSREAVVAEIRRQLDTIGDPCSVAHGSPMGLDEMGLVENLRVDRDGNVDIQLRLTSPTCVMVGYFKVEIEERIGQIPGVRTVSVVADHGLDWRPEMISDAAQLRRRAALAARGIPVLTEERPPRDGTLARRPVVSGQ